MKKHFEREWELVGFNNCEDEESQEMQDYMKQNILDVLDVVEKQGHSGGSMPYFLNMLNKALKFEPLTALTGKDEEWNDVASLSDGTILFQNKRYSCVFKDDSGVCKSGHYVFQEADGSCFTNSYSRKSISFPYVVEKNVYLKLPKLYDDMTDGDYEKLIKAFEMLEEKI